MSVHSPRRADPVVAAVLFVAAITSYACFAQSTDNPNVRTHMFLALSLVEDRSVRIDPYRRYTLDRASVDGHTYSEKAPGLAFTALPAVAVVGAVQRRAWPDARLLGEAPDVTGSFRSLTFLTTLGTVGVLGALAVVAVYGAALRLGAGPGGATVGACVLAWATPFWGWSTAMLGHVPAASLLVAGFLLVLLARDEGAARPGWGFAVGACLGWATVVELPSAGAAALIAGYGVHGLRRAGTGERARVIASAIAGGALALVPLAIYNALAFGAPWRLGYAVTEPWYPEMKEGLFGVGWPRPEVLWELIAGERRGLLWFAPAALLGLLCLPRIARDARAEAVLLASLTSYYLLLISGYAYWDGGWSTGPRHLTAVLPFTSIAVALGWRVAGRWGRTALLVGALVGAAASFVCVSTSMFVPDTLARPWGDFLIPAFRARAESRWPPVWGVFATVTPWELGLGHRAGLLAVATVPLAGAAAVAFRVSRVLRRTVPS